MTVHTIVHAAWIAPAANTPYSPRSVNESDLACIEVIMDVVFNHTAEGNELGATLCSRGIDNAIFYMLASDRHYYQNYAGTGNTINANHPVVRDHILSALRYCVVIMDVIDRLLQTGNKGIYLKQQLKDSLSRTGSTSTSTDVVDAGAG